jgi:hypothetical protein
VESIAAYIASDSPACAKIVVKNIVKLKRASVVNFGAAFPVETIGTNYGDRSIPS